MATKPVDEVRETVAGILAGHGVAPGPAALQADVLVEAELRGHSSHGLLRLRRIVERIDGGLCRPDTTGRHTWRGSGLLEVDGEHGLGPVVALTALETVAVRSREVGIAAAVVRDNNHLGMLGWYVERIAAAGQVAIAACTSEALVHPWGGRRAMVGTNPIAIGVPAHPDPLVLDMATACVSMGKIHDYARRAERLPSGWALDARGEPTTDATEASAGAIAPFGGGKGYGLGVALEVLVAALTATALGDDVRGTLDSVHASTKGDLFVVFGALPDSALAAVGGYLARLREVAPLEPDRPVLVPGDRARRRRAATLHEGIEIADETWTELTELADACRDNER